MSIKHFARTLAFAAAALVAVPALADTGSVTVTSELRLDKTVTANGQTTHQIVDPVADHDKVVPGNHLVFRDSYHNLGTTPVTNFVLTNPLPAAVVLSDDGFGSFDVSVDGKAFGPLATLTVDDGKGGKRPAQAADVKALRWVIAAIAPGASGTVEYHAVVR